MDFKAFDNSKLEQYAAEARKSWGGTKEYKEFEEKNISADEAVLVCPVDPYVDDSYFDGDLIGAIYDYLINECDLARPDANGIWRSPDNFCHGSKQIILSLRNRFINERADALAILTGGFNYAY